jgi:hypothetical protein
MEVFLIAAWEIWKHRNAVIFDGIRPNFQLWIVRFAKQIHLHLVRFNNDRSSLLADWLLSVQ